MAGRAGTLHLVLLGRGCGAKGAEKKKKVEKRESDPGPDCGEDRKSPLSITGIRIISCSVGPIISSS